MDIKLTTRICGPEGTYDPGAEMLGLDDDKARALIAANSAVEIARRSKETATARPGETASTAERESATVRKKIELAMKGSRGARKTVKEASAEPEIKAAYDHSAHPNALVTTNP